MKRNLLRKWMVALLCFAVAPLWAIEAVDGVYQIGSQEDLQAFAEIVNSGENVAANAVLTADITIDDSGLVIARATAQTYTGNFDGQGHTITFDNVTWSSPNTAAADATGLFGHLAGNVSNLRLEGTINAGGVRMAPLAGRLEGSSILKNIISNVTIKNSVTGDSACSGLVSRPSVGSSEIINCIFTGSIITETGSNAGGLVGWNPNDVITTIRNSAVAALIQVAPSTAQTPTNLIGRCLASNMPIKLDNVYYTMNEQNIGVEAILPDAVELPASAVKSGELAFRLNGDQSEISWYQKVGEDDYPSFDPSRGQVYLNGRAHCDGTPYEEAFYSNTNQGFTQDGHNFVDGVCTVCGAADPGFVTVGEDGYYELATPQQMAWFASKVNDGNPALNARIVASIDLTDIEWKPIGTVTSAYTGTFDGQMYPITNINNMLFGTITGAQITGIALESGEITGTDATFAAHTGSIVGHSTTKEGSVTNSYSKVRMAGGAGDLGGISGKYLGTLQNVYFAGAFASELGTWSLGGLLGSTNSTNTTFINDCFVFATWEEGLDPAYGARGGIVGWCHTNTPTNTYVIGDTFTKLLGDGTGSTSGCDFMTEDDFADGTVAWALNSGKFADVAWYQTLGSDPYPTLDPTHEIVYPTADGFASAGANNFEQMRNSLIDAEVAYCNNAVAYNELKNIYLEALRQLESITDRDAFIDAYSTVKVLRADVEASEKEYAAFAATVQDIYGKALESSIGGPDMELLLDYIENEYDPNEDYPNGSYPYIMAHTPLDGEQLTAEAEFVNRMWQTAQKNGYKAGDEISSMFTNNNFADGFNGWQYTKNGSTFTASNGLNEVMPAAESWNATFDLKQTVDGLTDGFYKLDVNAAFRAAGDIYNNNYAAWAYMNDNETYVMSEGEDVISEAEAQDLVNCYNNGGHVLYTEDDEIPDGSSVGGHIGTYDFYYGDYDNDIFGFVPYGPLSCSYAFNANRYVNTLVAQVTDGSLTIGLKLPGTGVSDDWMGFGNFRVTYLGDAENPLTIEAFDQTLAGMVARANTLIAYHGDSGELYRAKPEYSATLRAELEEEIAAVAAATDIAAKQALMDRFAETFRKIYECKKTYVEYMQLVENLYNSAWTQAATDSVLLNGTLLQEFQDFIDNVFAPKWESGAYTQEEAEEMADLKATSLHQYLYVDIPDFVDGKYQIGTAAELKSFAMMVNGGQNTVSAVLTADIVADPEQPMIGLTEATAFKGSFDGQGHTLTLNWTGDHALTQDPSGLFPYLAGPVSNLRLEGTIEAYAPRTGALTGRITAPVTISNVISNVTMVGYYAGDAALSGLLGRPSAAGVVVKNCMYTGLMISDVAANVGTIIGWNGAETTMINCAFLGTMKIKDKRASYGLTNVDSNLLGRFQNGTLTSQNCYYLPSNLSAEDLQEGYINVNNTLSGAKSVTPEQIANGYLCYNLNGDQSELVWYQTLGKDAQPVLDNTHLVVYLKDDGTYYNVGDGLQMATLEKLQPIVNVYDMQGRLVRSDVKAKEALQGLPSGLYIVGGKKTMVK